MLADLEQHAPEANHSRSIQAERLDRGATDR
jgi:hypothetical protein